MVSPEPPFSRLRKIRYLGFDNTPGSRHRKQDPAAPFVGVDEERMTLEGVQSQRLNETGGQIFTTKQCS